MIDSGIKRYRQVLNLRVEQVARVMLLRLLATSQYRLRRFEGTAASLGRIAETSRYSAADRGWRGCALILAGKRLEGRKLREQAGADTWNDC